MSIECFAYTDEIILYLCDIYIWVQSTICMQRLSTQNQPPTASPGKVKVNLQLQTMILNVWLILHLSRLN